MKLMVIITPIELRTVPQKYNVLHWHSVLLLNALFLDGIVISHLPDGPTAHFKLSSVKLGKEIKVQCILISFRTVAEYLVG